MDKERLYFFDVAKVIAIPLIIVHHIPDPNLSVYNTENIVLPVIGNLGLGSIGVFIFIFTSGALLYHNYPKINDPGKFLFRRLSRLYPAYWISILFGMALWMVLWEYQTPLGLMAQFSGLIIYIPSNWELFFNFMGWYIGLIATFYVAFPILAKWFEKHAPATIAIVVSASLIYRAVAYDWYPQIVAILGLDGYPPVKALHWYYSPLSNIGFFVLGMAAIRYGIYPKINKVGHIVFLADLSFYVFLVHYLLLQFWDLGPVVYIVGTLSLSLALMGIDKKLQTIIGRYRFPRFVRYD